MMAAIFFKNAHQKMRIPYAGLLGLLACLFCLAGAAWGQPQKIVPAGIWPDDKGNHVQVHGGGIIKLGDTYYWYGEDRTQGLDRNFRYVRCYSSTDLAHWTFRNTVLKLAPATVGLNGLILERPKVYYNAKTKKFVMYMHIDDNGYRAARVGVAVCDTPDGDYKYVNSFRPLGMESRDIGQFIDDDGTAYLIFEDRPNGFHIAKLSDDYMTVEKDMHLFAKMAIEGGAVVHYKDLYYVVGSHLTGWAANPNVYFTAKSLEGPWSGPTDIAPKEKKTYGAQSTMLLKVVGTKTTTVIYMGDVWLPSEQWNSRYLWMPLEIGDGKMWLPEPREWTLDVKTGEAVITGKDPVVVPTPAPRGRGGRGGLGFTSGTLGMRRGMRGTSGTLGMRRNPAAAPTPAAGAAR